MKRPKAVACAVAAAITVALLGGSAAAAGAVAVVTASEKSDEAARYLATQIDLPTVRRASANARHPELLVAEARANWHEDLVVVVDAEHATVSVVRPSDGTIGSRTLNPSAAAAPYAVALAAVELLEIVRNAPPAHTPPAHPPANRTQLRLAFDLGLMQTVGISGNLGLLVPTLGADLEFSREPSPVWFSVGLHGSGLAPSHRDLTLVLPGADSRGSIDYVRDELSLRLGVGHRQGSSAVFGWSEVGLAFLRLNAADDAGIFSARDRRTAIWLGLGAELRYTVIGGLALGLGAGVALLPVASRFYAAPPGFPIELTALREDNVDLRARASVIWEIAP